MAKSKIQELLANLKSTIQGTLSKDSSKEDIDRVNGLTAQIDSISQEADTIIKDKSDITELYVEAMKHQGSKEVVNDGASDAEDKPKSLEECIQEELAKQDDKK